ncbi:MAG TPA: TetR/AcrR family transcriptional regulator [Pseudonocardiaceae bacterium]|nr:TetR/AcrR family transcriptional regulator [Pseudonocardiaceae bacterium]
MFGKVGRPPEDRIARQRHIWAAVSPLIEQRGARAVTMRDAAVASSLSLGGLYHYFPNKRTLVLFGTDQAAHERICLEFQERYGYLRRQDPAAHAEAFVRFFAGQLTFVRPAVQAALELGAEEFRARLAANLTMGLDGFLETLRLVAPDAAVGDLRALAKSIRRLFFAGLVDPAVTGNEFETDLRALVSPVLSAPGHRSLPAGASPRSDGASANR